MNDVFDEGRLERILSKLPKEEIGLIRNALNTLYPSCKTETKIVVLNYLKDKADLLDTTYMNFMGSIYGNGYKDAVYYGIMANVLNKHFDINRRRRNV